MKEEMFLEDKKAVEFICIQGSSLVSYKQNTSKEKKNKIPFYNMGLRE